MKAERTRGETKGLSEAPGPVQSGACADFFFSREKKYARDERGKKATIAQTFMTLHSITPDTRQRSERS
jgi:hypothetical protein